MHGRRNWWEILMPWFSRYSDWRVRGRGKKDGEALRPAWDAEALPPFLVSLGRVGGQDLRALAKDWHVEDRKYKAEFVLAHRAHEAATKAAAKAEREASAALDKYEEANGHRLWKGSSRPVWWLALLCLLEVPFNAAAFRGVGGTEVVAWVLALVVGVLLAILGHYFGRQLRKEMDAVHLSVYLGLPCAVIALGAYVRVHYAASRTASTEAPDFGVTLGFFVAINLLFYAVATIASYWRHVPFGTEVLHTQRLLHGAADKRDKAQEALEEAVVRRQKKFLEKQEHAAWIEQEVGRLRDVYWTANLDKRTDADAKTTHYPKSYDCQIEVKMPDELRVLNWESIAAPTNSPSVNQANVARVQIPLTQTWTTNTQERGKRSEVFEEVEQ